MQIKTSNFPSEKEKKSDENHCHYPTFVSQGQRLIKKNPRL
jgi:hypothetical protein